MNQSTAGRLPARTLTALAVTAALGAFSQSALAQTTNAQATAPAASISASKPSQSNKTSAKKVSASRSVKLDTVLVTARNRSEAAQNVPLPIRVVGGERLDREDIKSLWDLPSIAPNLQLNNPGENARKVSPGIRGLGRGGANDSMEQSVGTIVDGVTLYYSGQAWADYVDLDRIEVLYGPQGTLVGKNTSLGAIKIATKAPSFKAASRFEVQTGDQNTLQGKFSTTGPLIDDKLAYRGTFLVTRQDGLYENTYQSLGKAKETWREANKVAGRVQFLWTPTADLRGRFIFDKLRSDERVNTGNVLESNGPATFADGTARPLTTPVIANTGFTPKGSYATFGYLGKFAERAAWFHLADGTVYQPKLGTTDIENSEARPQITNQYGGSAQFDWDRDGYSLTSISAYRYQDFDIKNGGQFGPFYISNSGQQLWNDQISQELRITTTPAPGKAWDYQAGLYYLDAEVYSDDPSYYGPDAGAWNATRAQFTTLVANENAPLRAAGRELLRASHDGIYQSSVTDATTKSLAVYGQADWHLTDKANLAFGLRLTDEEKHNKIATELDRPGQDLDQLGAQLGATAAQIAAAKAVRLRSVPIAPFSFVAGKPIEDTLVAWNISPSYKLSPDINLYASVGKGVKAGFIYFQQYVAPTDKGFETTIKAEETLDFELGFKSLLLDRTLQWNANLYNTEVKDYQASWRRNNPDAPGETIAGWGNAPKVLARGVETEVNYRVNAELDLNLAAAYNKATYEAEWLVQKPEILATNQYFDANGQQIANVPKTVINYGLSYVTPWEGFLWRATLQNTFKSSSYFNDNQAAFTRQGSYTVSNLSLGFGSEDKKWELALQVRNLFDKEYSLSRSTYTATAGQTLTIGQPRLFQLNLKYSL